MFNILFSTLAFIISPILSSPLDPPTQKLSQYEKFLCCSTLYVSAKDVLAKEQGALLGKYMFEGMDKDKNAIYFKLLGEQKIYLYFRNNGTFGQGTNGWTIGELFGDSYYVTTRNMNGGCPEGIQGAYDRDITIDTSFSIQCHDERVKVECCPEVKVNSLNMKSQASHFGVYSLNGSYNGYPVYTKNTKFLNSLLYFRKTGYSDGWIITSSHLGDNLFAITTNSESYCPNEVKSGYDHNRVFDETFDIECVVRPAGFSNQNQHRTENSKSRVTQPQPNQHDHSSKVSYVQTTPAVDLKQIEAQIGNLNSQSTLEDLIEAIQPQDKNNGNSKSMLDKLTKTLSIAAFLSNIF